MFIYYILNRKLGIKFWKPKKMDGRRRGGGLAGAWTVERLPSQRLTATNCRLASVKLARTGGRSAFRRVRDGRRKHTSRPSRWRGLFAAPSARRNRPATDFDAHTRRDRTCDRPRTRHVKRAGTRERRSSQSVAGRPVTGATAHRYHRAREEFNAPTPPARNTSSASFHNSRKVNIKITNPIGSHSNDSCLFWRI